VSPNISQSIAQYNLDVAALQVACNTLVGAASRYDSAHIVGLVVKFFDESDIPHMSIKLEFDTLAMAMLNGAGFLSELISKFADAGFDLRQPPSPGKSSAAMMLFISRRI